MLTRTSGSSAADAVLVQRLQDCAGATLSRLAALPPHAAVPADVLVVLFVVLRATPRFWPEERCAALAQLLDAHVDTMALQTWRPRVVIAAVHAVAKACSAQAHLPFVTDCFARLHHCEPQLAEHDVAAVLWSMATLQLAAPLQSQWATLCRRAMLLYPRMHQVSRLTVTQALLLQPELLCEAQAELLHVVYSAADDNTSGALERESRAGRGRRRRTSASVASPSLASSSPKDMESAAGATAQLLRFTTNTLSDGALVRLLLTLLLRRPVPAAELRLVVAHFTLRSALAEGLCLQVLRSVQPLSRPATPPVGTPRTPSPGSVEVDGEAELDMLLRKTRHHAVRRLLQVVHAGPVRSPRAALEVLCLEHRDSFCQADQPSDASTDPTSQGVQLGAALGTVLSGCSARAGDVLRGDELWGWHCVAAYLRAALHGGAATPGLRDGEGRLRELELQLQSTVRPEQHWPNARERLARCTELVAAAALSGATALLLPPPPSDAASDAVPSAAAALALVEACVQELRVSAAALAVPSTLQLLSAVDGAAVVVAASVRPLRPLLLAQLETHTSRASGMLPSVVQYLTAALAQPATAAGHVRISDTVLDVYVRLLIQEQQRVVTAAHAELLVRCLEERRRSPPALESAYMMLLTRRLGQTASLLKSATLPTHELCALIRLTGALPRGTGAASTATAALILSTLLDQLLEAAVPACTTAEELVECAVLLGDGAVYEVHRASALAAAVQAKGVWLLQQQAPRAPWTPEQKAYLVAALVCAGETPTPELVCALRGDSDTAGID